MTNPAEDVTRRLLFDAGVRDGMRVLDIGCGHGDVTLLAAALVGKNGSVLGVDRDERPLAAARIRARDLNLAQVAFARGSLDILTPEHGVFDAVIGRRVLMYQPDAVACLSRLKNVLAPGGLIVLQEHDSTGMPICLPAMPLHQKVNGWIWKTVTHEGADLQMGLHLAPALTLAGFRIERVRAEATVLTADQVHHIASIIRAMFTRIVDAGVATPEEIAIDSLEQQLEAERRAANGTCIWEMVFGAWARKPG
jgi:2-polyprenyl-3-methyl-5-hydroxy-6-metoxy-1,4-benzoquinol methylase